MGPAAGHRPGHIGGVATDDRRRRARIETRTVGWLFPSDDPHERSQAIIITDLSKLGVGFIYPTELVPGTICKIRVGLGPRRLAKRLRIASSRSTRAIIGLYA